jgi:hypothetical protein
MRASFYFTARYPAMALIVGGILLLILSTAFPELAKWGGILIALGILLHLLWFIARMGGFPARLVSIISVRIFETAPFSKIPLVVYKGVAGRLVSHPSGFPAPSGCGSTRTPCFFSRPTSAPPDASGDAVFGFTGYLDGLDV